MPLNAVHNFENNKKDILKPISSMAKGISKNHETAILNALNIRVEDRTPDMETFLQEIESTEKVHRRSYRIRKIDLYKWPAWLKITVSATSACLILFIILFLTGVIGFDAHLKTDFILPEGKTRVPSVVNTDFDKAEEKLGQHRIYRYQANRI